MKIANFRIPTPGEFPGVSEETMKVVEVLSRQVDQLTRCLQSNVSPEDNGNVELRTIPFKSGEEKSIRVTEIKGKVVEVTLVSHSAYDSAKLAWIPVREDEVKITITFDNTPAGSIDCTLLVRGESDA